MPNRNSKKRSWKNFGHGDRAVLALIGSLFIFTAVFYFGSPEPGITAHEVLEQKPAVCQGYFGDSVCDDSPADCGSYYDQDTTLDACDECQTTNKDGDLGFDKCGLGG